MEAIDALRSATDAFAERLRSTSSDTWANPTPCDEWDVRALINHMLLGTRMSVQLLDGMGRDEVIAGLNDDLVSAGDPSQAFDRMAGEMMAGFAADGALEGTVDHPMDVIPTRLFLSFRALDAAVHAWDLATGTGGDRQLDGELVQWLWDDVQPMAGGLAETGIFGSGASGELGDDASLQDRYLDLVGRRP